MSGVAGGSSRLARSESRCESLYGNGKYENPEGSPPSGFCGSSSASRSSIRLERLVGHLTVDDRVERRQPVMFTGRCAASLGSERGEVPVSARAGHVQVVMDMTGPRNSQCHRLGDLFQVVAGDSAVEDDVL